MSESQEVSIKEDFKNLIKAIYALLPSRNAVSQLIMLLPLREESIEELFPEVTEDVEYWEIFRTALGLRKSYMESIGAPSYSTIAGALRDFINRVFEFLSDERNRAAISSLLGELVPNAEREWLEVRIKAVLKNPLIGDTARKILMLLTETSNINVKELSSKLNIKEPEVKQCIYVLSSFKLIEVSGESISIPYRVKDRYSSYIKKLLGEAER